MVAALLCALVNVGEEYNVEEWWAHNLSNFEVLFVIEGVKRMGWTLEATRSEQRLIEALLTAPDGRKVRLLDSFNVAPASLRENAKDFRLKSQKRFEEKAYKKDMRNLPVEELQAGCLADCEVVLELLEAIDALAVDWGGTLKRTFAATSLGIVKTELKQRGIPLPRFAADVTMRWVNQTCDWGRLGGRTEVFEHMPDFLLTEVDLTSSYPWAMAQPHPWEFLGHVTRKVDLLSLYNAGAQMMVRATVRVPVCDMPPLPFRLDVEDRELFFPTGTWEGWFVAEELRYAEAACDVDVLLHEGLLFEEANLFEGFVSKVFETKRKSTGALRAFAKLNLVSCYGKFGESPEHERLMVLPSKEAGLAYMAAHRGRCSVPYEDESVLQVKHFRWSTHAHYALAATITARGRIRLHQGLMEAIRPCYSDTDSIHCRSFRGALSDELGGWKEELTGYAASFYAAKLYRLRMAAPCPEGCMDDSHRWHDENRRALFLAAKGFPVDPVNFEAVVESAQPDAPKVKIERMRLMKGQLRAADGETVRIVVRKQWRGFSVKRRPLANGRTVPWTVKELRAGKHLQAKSPLLGPPPEVESGEDDAPCLPWWPVHRNG